MMLHGTLRVATPGTMTDTDGLLLLPFTQHHNDVSLVHDHDTMVVDSCGDVG